MDFLDHAYDELGKPVDLFKQGNQVHADLYCRDKDPRRLIKDEFYRVVGPLLGIERSVVPLVRRDTVHYDSQDPVKSDEVREAIAQVFELRGREVALSEYELNPDIKLLLGNLALSYELHDPESYKNLEIVLGNIMSQTPGSFPMALRYVMGSIDFPYYSEGMTPSDLVSVDGRFDMGNRYTEIGPELVRLGDSGILSDHVTDLKQLNFIGGPARLNGLSHLPEGVTGFLSHLCANGVRELPASLRWFGGSVDFASLEKGPEQDLYFGGDLHVKDGFVFGKGAVNVKNIYIADPLMRRQKEWVGELPQGSVVRGA